MVFELRPGRKFYSIPGMGFRAYMPAAAAVSPWLAGGVPAANCKRAYIPLGKADLAASYVDLTGNQDAAPGSAPGFDAAYGWQFTASKYLTTGLIPTGTTSVVIRASNYTSGAGTYAFYGSRPTGYSGYEFYPCRLASPDRHRCYFVNTSDTTPGMTSGVVIMTPTGCWIDGTRYNTYSASFSPGSHGLFINGINNNGSLSYGCAFYCQCWWAYNIDLNTGSYIADLTSAAQALAA